MRFFRFRAVALTMAAVPFVHPVSLHAAPADPGSPAPPTFQEEMVVTANLVASPADQVGSSVTVIGPEEIERRGEASVADLLRTVPGLEVSQGGGPGSVAGVFIRGGNSNHTLVLIDGVRVTNTSGGFDFSALRADNVERIEILRGPQSTLYGSEAIGGVISITTRQGRRGNHLEADARGGSHDSHEVRLSADGGTSRFDYSVAASDQRAGGLSVASERRGNHETDPFTDRGGSARVGFTVLGDGRADVTMRLFDANSALDGFAIGIGPTDDPNFEQRRRVAVGSLQVAKPVTSWWDLHLNASATEDKSHGSDPDTIENNFDFRSRLTALRAQSDFRLAGGNTLVAGLSSERRQGENQGSYDESLDVSSAYLQDAWSWRSRLFLTGGLRYDHYSRFGDETTWRGTASYAAGSAWRLHGSYGTGFRGPSFDELYFPFVGNTALKPETSRGYDLGVERRFSRGGAVADLTLFSNRFDDLINFDFATSLFNNVQRASSQGVEATFRVRPRQDLSLSAAYTYDDTEDRATRRPLARRPRHRASLLAAWDLSEALRTTASLVAVRDRTDSDGTKMDDYERLDLTVEYSVRPWLQPYVLVTNALGQRYEEVTGYDTPGLSAFLGLRLRYQ